MDVIQKTKEYNQQNKHTIKKALQSTQGETWQTISELTSQKSGKKSVTSLKVNGLKITNPAKISDEFNHHFFTIGPKLPSEIDSDSGDYGGISLAQIHDFIFTLPIQTKPIQTRYFHL